MVPRMNSPSLLVLGVAALIVYSSFASKVTSAMRAPANDAVVIQEGRPYCEVMVPCNIPKCALLCAGNGLTSALGFCTMKPDYQVYGCCPVPNS